LRREKLCVFAREMDGNRRYQVPGDRIVQSEALRFRGRWTGIAGTRCQVTGLRRAKLCVFAREMDGNRRAALCAIQRNSEFRISLIPAFHARLDPTGRSRCATSLKGAASSFTYVPIGKPKYSSGQNEAGSADVGAVSLRLRFCVIGYSHLCGRYHVKNGRGRQSALTSALPTLSFTLYPFTFFSGNFPGRRRASSTAALFPKHSRIVIERFRRAHENLLVVGMGRIDQAVILAGSENRRHPQ